MKKRVIIPVETKSREFHGKLFLALHLLHKGFPVLFGEQGRLWNYCDLVDPAIFLDKSVAATRTEWFQRCRAMGHEIVSWDEEGLVFFNNWLYRKQRIVPETFNQVRRFFAWGETQREAICEEYPQFSEKIVLCGNPRFDFLRPELRSFYSPRVAELSRQFGPMILINTNFAFYNHFKSPEEVRQLLARYPINNEPGYMDKWITMHKEMHEAYLAMTPALLQRFPDHAIVVRPHPSESHKPWLALAKSHPRLHVDSSGNVHEWILASEAVVHFNCTTAIEAFLLDIPAIAYRPARYPNYENFLPNALSENAFSLDELLKALEGRKTARERGALWTADQHQAAARYMTGLNGPTAAMRVANEIEAIANERPPTQSSITARALATAKRLWRIRLHEKREAGSRDNEYASQKFPGLARAEINDTLQRMTNISGVHARFTIRPFAKNCFWLIPNESRS